MPPRPKPGEGIILVVDVSPGVRASLETTFFSLAQDCIINILQRKIFADKCRDMVGIVLFGTDETKNNLATSDQYQNIMVFQEPKFVYWEVIRQAKSLPRGNSSGDWLDAVVVAMDLLQDPGGILYDTRKVVLITDFNCEFSDDKVEVIIEGLRDSQIELSVIGPDLDDTDEDGEVDRSHGGPSSNGHHSTPQNWNGKPKTSQQMAAECLIKRIVSEVEGIICSFDEAIPQLMLYEKKNQGSANWNAMLDLGPDFRIPVCGNIKVKRSVAPSWRRCCVDDETAAILSETSYHKKDENQTVVESDDVILGYRYGASLVPFGQADRQLNYACEAPGAALSIIGFTSSAHVPLSLRFGDQVLNVTAKVGDEDGAVALSALIQALNELDMIAICRRVYRKNLNPTLGFLYPDITEDYECLVWIGLPFCEDVRDFSFPSLTETQTRLSSDQTDLIDQLIDDMQLETDGDGNEDDLNPCNVVNPNLQHYYNCLTRRALFPSEPVPAPESHVLSILSTPEEQDLRRRKLVDKLKQFFPTTKQQDYKQKRIDVFAKAAAEADLQNNSSEGSDSRDVALSAKDIGAANVRKISTATPVDDFRALLRGDLPHYEDICRQMSDVLIQLCEAMSGDRSADRVLTDKLIEALRVFREESVAIGPSPYNEFIRGLKRVTKAKKLQEFWNFISREKLGLISSSENLRSTVSGVEAERFLADEDQAPQEAMDAAAVCEGIDYDDMLDDL